MEHIRRSKNPSRGWDSGVSGVGWVETQRRVAGAELGEMKLGPNPAYGTGRQVKERFLTPFIVRQSQDGERFLDAVHPVRDREP